MHRKQLSWAAVTGKVGVVIASGLAAVLLGPSAAHAGDIYLAHYGESKKFQLRSPASVTYINLNVHVDDSKWGTDPQPPQMDSLRLKLACPDEQCRAAKWKLVFRRVDGDDLIQRYSSHESIGATFAPVLFDFTRAGSPTLWASDVSENGPLNIRMECASNCPALASSWPIASGAEPGERRDMVLYDVAKGQLLPWFELRTHVAPPGIGEVGQFRADGTTPVAEGGMVGGNAVRLKAKLKAGPGTKVALQVEVRKKGEAFTGVATHQSAWQTATAFADLTVPDLTSGAWHWRYRVAAAADRFTPWTEFRSVGDTDFRVE